LVNLRARVGCSQIRDRGEGAIIGTMNSEQFILGEKHTAAELTLRRLAAIMACDMVGYSRLTGADEEDTHRRLKLLRQKTFGPRIEAAMVVKVNPAGSVVFSSPLGNLSQGQAIATDPSGNVWVSGFGCGSSACVPAGGSVALPLGVCSGWM